MGCCGQGRAALKAAVTPPRPNNDLMSAPARATYSAPAALAPARPVQSVMPPGAAESVTRPPGKSVRLHYSARVPIQVRGAASGTLYRFSAEQSQAWVDAGDAAELLASRFFVAAGPVY